MIPKQLKYKNIINCFSNYFVTKGQKKKKITNLINFLKVKKIIRKQKSIRFKHIFLFFFIICRLRPIVELKVIRKGSKNYTFPVPLKKHRSFRKSLRWISILIKNGRGRKFNNRIKKEFISVLKKEGSAWKNFREVQQIAAENILYSHYRWR